MKRKIQLTLSILPSLLPIACKLQYAGNRSNMYAENQVATSSAEESMRTDVSNQGTAAGSMQLVARMDSENANRIRISVESTNSQDEDEERKKFFLDKWLETKKDWLNEHTKCRVGTGSSITCLGQDLYNLFKNQPEICLKIEPRPTPKKATLKGLYKELDRSIQTIGGEQYQFPSAYDTMGGNVGRVYKVYNVTRKEDMVVKLLLKNNQEPLQVQQIMAVGGHTNIVDYYGVYELLGFNCIVMEYIKGHKPTNSFEKRLLDEKRSIVQTFCRQNGIIMTDDGPTENALFTRDKNGDETIKLFDFDPDGNP